MPKLTIITVNLNNREGLQRTIQSVINQTFTDFEYIVIDGGSTDGSVDLIKQHAERITYWVSEPDNGIYHAMNKGILKAKGEYLLFLNSGDWLAKNEALDQVIPFLKEDIDIVSGYVKELNGDKSYKYPPKTFTFKSFYNSNIPHQSEFIKKDLFVRIGLYNEHFQILSDYEFNIKALCHYAHYRYVDLLISYIDTTGISYQSDEGNTIQNERIQILTSTIPSGILEDYKFFLDLENEFHPALKWAKDNRLIFKVLRFIYNHFSKEKKSRRR